jgi:hypothetical protein
MADTRWWVKPGEIVWVGNTVEGHWRVIYEADDGNVWAFTALGEGGQSHPFRFDHRSPLLISDGSNAHIPNVLGLVYKYIEKRIGISPQPQSLHQRILDELARQLSTHDWIDGKLLRSELRPIAREATMAALQELVPRYVRQHPSSDFHGAIDAYTLTFGGMLASNRGGEIPRIVEGVLGLLAEKFDHDPTFRAYKLSEVLQKLSLSTDSAIFVQNVVSISGLSFGSGGSGTKLTFGRPADIEDLEGVASLSQFLDYLRLAKTDRPWPTAPLNLPDDQREIALPEEPVVATVPNEPLSPAASMPPTSKRQSLVVRTWRDPVWSKVIAGGILAAAGIAIALLRHRFGL